MGGIVRTWAAALAFAAPVIVGSPMPAATASEPTSVVVDGHDGGRAFDGVGAVSASSSKLLHDYPEPERREILDYLFRPDYGASLQVLKVEIGSDANSTVTAEPSHARTPGELRCDRGFEWWLMKEAKKRNPNITLYALPWGLPGWIPGGRWSAGHVSYVLSWLTCARRNGLRIDAVGGSNEEYERPPVGSYFIALKQALAKNFPDVKVVATDEHAPPDYFYQATQMKADPAYGAAVDILGEHDVCVWRSLYQHCNANQDARDSGKPLWNSEQSSQDVMAGAGPLARAMTRNYIDARVTGNINWALAGGFYDNTEVGGTGLLAAQWPWSGHYELGPSIWVDAQTTQFVQPGWRYLDGAAGYLPGGGSHVALRDPNSGDYTVVFETMDATAPEAVRIAATGGLRTGPAAVWSTDLTSDDPRDWFVRTGTVTDGATLVLQPGHVYTVSTTTGQRKGAASPPPASGTVPLPYRQGFESVARGGGARLFQDVAGAFEAQPCPAGRGGTCLDQVVERQPYLWHDGGADPVTIVGDPLWWGDYEAGVMARLDRAGAVELLGRVDKYNAYLVSGYHLRLAADGTWQLYTQAGTDGATAVLAAGTIGSAAGWHRLSMSFHGDRITAVIDGRTVAAVTDDRHLTGQVGLAVGDWNRAEFDDLTVRPTAPEPAPATPVGATATGAQPGVSTHHRYDPGQAVDGRLGSWWQSPFNPPASLPQAITLDLGRVRATHGLIYRPPLNALGAGGTITGYRAYVSADGKDFQQVAAGSWRPDMGVKTASWQAWPARYVRLEATASQDGSSAAAAEVDVALAPFG